MADLQLFHTTTTLVPWLRETGYHMLTGWMMWETCCACSKEERKSDGHVSVQIDSKQCVKMLSLVEIMSEYVR